MRLVSLCLLRSSYGVSKTYMRVLLGNYMHETAKGQSPQDNNLYSQRIYNTRQHLAVQYGYLPVVTSFSEILQL